MRLSLAWAYPTIGYRDSGGAPRMMALSTCFKLRAKFSDLQLQLQLKIQIRVKVKVRVKVRVRVRVKGRVKVRFRVRGMQPEL